MIAQQKEEEEKERIRREEEERKRLEEQRKREEEERKKREGTVFLNFSKKCFSLELDPQGQGCFWSDDFRENSLYESTVSPDSDRIKTFDFKISETQKSKVFVSL